MRASLARSLVNNPSLFLFDEPFGELLCELLEECRFGIRPTPTF